MNLGQTQIILGQIKNQDQQVRSKAFFSNGPHISGDAQACFGAIFLGHIGEHSWHTHAQSTINTKSHSQIGKHWQYSITLHTRDVNLILHCGATFRLL